VVFVPQATLVQILNFFAIGKVVLYAVFKKWFMPPQLLALPVPDECQMSFFDNLQHSNVPTFWIFCSSKKSTFLLAHSMIDACS